MGGLAARVLPIWLTRYDARAFGADLLAALILAVLLVPQAMAYALLAGLPPEIGLYTAMTAPIVYALIGRSAYVSAGPVALVSLLAADAIARSGLSATEAGVIVALEAGAMLLALGALRLGQLVNFISEPAILGFTAAAAVLIASSQLPPLLGLEAQRAGTVIGAAGSLAAAGPVDRATLTVGATALAALVLGNFAAEPALARLGLPGWARLALAKTIPLAVIVSAALAADRLPDEIARVQEIPGALPRPVLPPFDPAAWTALLGPSALVAVIAFVGGMAVAKTFSARRRAPLDTSREAAALGAANLAAGAFGGYATGVSLSRSALVFASDARSPLASAMAGAIVLPVILFGGPLLATLPETALAALVISAVFGLIKPREIAGVWRHAVADGLVLLATFLATLAFGVQWGLLTGALAGIARFLWSSAHPRITRLGPARDGAWRSLDRGEIESAGPRRVLVVRVDSSIYFANAAHCEERLGAILAEHSEARALLLDMAAVNEIDASGMRMLDRLLRSLEEQDVRVAFAALHLPVREALERMAPNGYPQCFLTVEEGVRRLRRAVA